VPKHRAPDVVLASGLAQDGFVPVDPATLQTSHPGVYAIGDVATAGVPKAGMFAENSARVLGQNLLAQLRGSDERAVHRAVGSCYVEFGGGAVGRVDLDFDAGAEPNGTFAGPSAELAADKRRFAADRRKRWFGD
jgi:sulfide:quinone oxidoreductase